MLAVLLSAASALGVVVPVGLALSQRKRQARKAAQRAPAATPPQAPVEAPPRPMPTPAQLPEQRSAKEESSGSLLQKGLEAITTGSVVAGGMVASELGGRVVEAVGGEGRGDVARLLGPVFVVPFLVDAGVNKGLEALGVKEERHRKALGQVAATASVVPPLVPLIATVHAASEVLELISPEANRAARDFTKQFDPTNPKTGVGQLVGGVTGVLFGKPKKEPERVVRGETPAERAAREARERRVALQAERREGAMRRKGRVADEF